MIQSIIYKYKLYKLSKKEHENNKFYIEKHSELKQNNAPKNEVDFLIIEQCTERSIIDYEIETLTTSFYLVLARKNFIEIPPLSDESSWTSTELDPNHFVLSNKAISEIRTKLVSYRKERNDSFVPVITSVTGLLGAVIAIISLLINL